mmetsp:Transcript_3859/g.8851  ORF Transcript_3859/g.8851 Transcript_3859/m.8851 type:complete len:171 (+) Transcript_3859:7073-7585(+)
MMKSIVAVSFLWLLQAASSFDVRTPTSSKATIRSKTAALSTTKLNLYASIEDAITEAQRVCAMNPESQECKVAWDIVEELEAADSHRDAAGRQIAPDMTPTNMSPDLVAMVASFDILSQKIDGKMEQLLATTNKLQELGADDPAIAELGARAADMRQVLAYVNENLKGQV